MDTLDMNKKSSHEEYVSEREYQELEKKVSEELEGITPMYHD